MLDRRLNQGNFGEQEIGEDTFELRCVLRWRFKLQAFEESSRGSGVTIIFLQALAQSSSNPQLEQVFPPQVGSLRRLACLSLTTSAFAGKIKRATA